MIRHLVMLGATGDLTRRSQYGRLLLGVLDGNPTFSFRDDEAEEAWRVIEPIAAAWRGGLTPHGEYEAGLAGPGAR